jgi:hypothetical protein
VEFLDSVLESTRKQEAAVKRQTREELEAFKRQQQEAEQAAKGVVEPEAPMSTDTWTVSRKRKKGRDDVLGGVKLRKASSGAKAADDSAKVEGPASTPAMMAAKEPSPEKAASIVASSAEDAVSESAAVKEASSPATAVAKLSTSPSPKPSTGLGLVAYSSDEED